jgi:hypothetical protein
MSNSKVSGNKSSGTYGSYDYWILKLSATGMKLWETNYGGLDNDTLTCLQLTADGGCIVGGYSASTVSGNKTCGTFGLMDAWIIKLAADGRLQWQTNYGGADNDAFSSLRQTPDGGFIVGGQTFSHSSGNKTSGSFGGCDYWLLKLTDYGAKEWEMNYGGTADDYLNDVSQTSDHGYILGGSSYSGVSGNKTTTRSDARYASFWVLKVSEVGIIQWQDGFSAALGGGCRRAFETDDGGCLMIGNIEFGSSYSSPSSARPAWIDNVLLKRAGPLRLLPSSVVATPDKGIQFQFTGGVPGQTHNVEASDNFSVWAAIGSQINTGSPTTFKDQSAHSTSRRFYRVK